MRPVLAGLSSYALCIVLGILTAVLSAWKEIRRGGPSLKPEHFLAGIVSCIAAGFLFSGLVTTCIFHRGESVVAFSFLPGAACGVVLFVFIFRKHNPGALLECCAPALPLGQAFGRIGCFLHGCCFGIRSEHFGVVFPEGSPPALLYGADVGVFPVQLLESAFLFALSFLLHGLSAGSFPRRISLGLIVYGCGRFALEQLRGDSRGSLPGLSFLSPSQWISLFLVLAGSALLLPSFINRRT